MEVGDVTKHKGNKDHKCAWCGEIIPKGEEFIHCKGKWEGDWQNWRMHLECDNAVMKSKYIDISDGFTPFSGKRGSDEEK